MSVLCDGLAFFSRCLLVFVLSDPTFVLIDPTYVLSDPTFVLSDPTFVLSDPTFVLSYAGMSQGNLCYF